MDAVKNFFNKMSKESKLLLGFALIVIACTMYRDCFLCKYIPKLDGFKLKEKFENLENFEDSAKPNMVLFYAPWCPHCKSMMGDWKRLRNRVGPKMEVIDVNCDEQPEMAEKYNVNGFPTIILFKNGKKIHFEGPRKLQNFLQFVKENDISTESESESESETEDFTDSTAESASKTSSDSSSKEMKKKEEKKDEKMKEEKKDDKKEQKKEEKKEMKEGFRSRGGSKNRNKNSKKYK